MIQRYGFEQTYYFKVRNFFICPLFFSLISVFVATILIGWSYDLPFTSIWRRFSGWTDNKILMENYISQISLILITLPVQFSIWRLTTNLKRDLQAFYDYSEEKNGETDFWYQIRTSIIDSCNKYDIPAVHTQAFLQKKIDFINTHKGVEEIGEARIEEVMAVPDFAKLTNIELKTFWIKSSFDEDQEHCWCCYRPCGQCFCPGYNYKYDKFEEKILEQDKQLKEQIDGEFHSSSFVFFATNSVMANDWQSSNLNDKVDELQDCIDCCFCKQCQKWCPDTFKHANYITDKQKQEEEEELLAPNDQEEIEVLDDTIVIDDTNTEPLIIKEEEIKSQKAAEDVETIAVVTVPELAHEKEKTKKTRCCCNKNKDNETTNVAIKEQKLMKPSDYYPSSTFIEANNVVDPDDLCWFNIGFTVKETLIEKIIWFFVIIVMFQFLSTPAAMLQLFKRVKFMKNFINGDWTKHLGPVFGPFIKTYLTTGVTLQTNKIFLTIICWIGRGSRFPSKSTFHGYVLTMSYQYYTLNMVIMPGLSLAGGNSIFKLLDNEKIDFRKIIESFHLIDHGSFFVNLIFQSVGIGFLMVHLNLYDFLVLGFGNFNLASSLRALISKERWLQKEKTLLPFGTNMAYFSTIMTLVCVFGYMAPMIIIPCILYIIIRNLGDCQQMVCVHKKETEEFGKLAAMGLKRIMTGVLLGHSLLLFLSYYNGRFYAFGINLVIIALYIAFTILMSIRLKKINNLECLDMSKEDLGKEWSTEQKKRWSQMFSHPIIKKRPQIVNELYISAKKKQEEDPESMDLDRIVRFMKRCHFEFEGIEGEAQVNEVVAQLIILMFFS